MRDLIRLIENAQAFVTEEGFRVWLDEQKQSPTFAEGDFDYSLEIIEEWGWDNFIETTNRQFGEMPSPLKLYRGLHLAYGDASEVPAMLFNPIGASWTWEFGVAINENGPETGYARHGEDESTNVVLEGEVSKMDVDWYYTAFLTVAEFDEPEIRLKKGGVVHVHACHLLDDHCWDKHGHHQIQSGTGQFASESRERIMQTLPLSKTFRA